MLGNGDIFEADDALAMMAATGCDGVVIGRGCLGRPWLFAELSAAFTGSPTPRRRRHWARSPTSSAGTAQLLAAHFGEDKGMRDIRKHIAWYLHGFPAGADLRRALALVKTLDELDDLLDQARPRRAVSRGRDRPARTPGLTRVGDAAGGLARRSGRLHGACRGRRDAFRWLNRDGPDIVELAVSQDVSVR